MSTTTVFVIVIGSNRAAMSDMEKYEITCTESQYAVGDHFRAAENHAIEELGYDERIVSIDSTEGAFDYIEASFPVQRKLDLTKQKLYHCVAEIDVYADSYEEAASKADADLRNPESLGLVIRVSDEQRTKTLEIDTSGELETQRVD